MPWLWLAAAGLAEVGWVALLKRSDGFTRPGPSVAVAAVIAASFFCMSQALRGLPMGTVYAVWTGLGAAGGLAWGILVEHEPAGLVRLGGVCLILAGVAAIRLGG